jgi:penicillin-binding protein 1A
VGFDAKVNSLGRGADGSRAALPIWIDFWKAATADLPVEESPIPGNIVFVPVDSSGRPGAPGAPGVRMETFVAGTEPQVLPASLTGSP